MAMVGGRVVVVGVVVVMVHSGFGGGSVNGWR